MRDRRLICVSFLPLTCKGFFFFFKTTAYESIKASHGSKRATDSSLFMTVSVPVKTQQHLIMDQVCWHPLSYYSPAQSKYVYPAAHMVAIRKTPTTKPQC